VRNIELSSLDLASLVCYWSFFYCLHSGLFRISNSKERLLNCHSLALVGVQSCEQSLGIEFQVEETLSYSSMVPRSS
jgi:hypothetical protein